MGLDQFAYRREADEDEDGNITIAEWRKHNRLHGWMEALYRDKGEEAQEEVEGVFGSSFNCVELELTESDIEQFEAHVTDKALPETEGFFFGGDSYEEYEEYHKNTDLEFIKEAYEAFESGQKVYYNSWW
jgi:hypothetical protein